MAKIKNIQKLITWEECNELYGSKPQAPDLQPIPFEKRNEIFHAIINEKVEYRYLNGSCESRAHYIGLFLNKMNVRAGKIWNFAPARYTFISDELFLLKDHFEMVDETTWGYHVAPIIKAYKEDGSTETLVIDLTFNEIGYLKIDEWLSRMPCSQSIHLTTDLDSFLFNSIDGFEVYDISMNPSPSYIMPTFLPSIITGNFWKLTAEDYNVQRGLAFNDLAIEISRLKDTLEVGERDYLLQLLKNIDDLTAFINNPPYLEVFPEKTYNSLASFYFDRHAYWDNKIKALHTN